MKQSQLFLSDRRSALFSLNRHLCGRRYDGATFFILVDSATARHCLPYVVSQMPVLQESTFFELPRGAKGKSLRVAESLWAALHDSGADRDSVVVNLGGGTVSDMGGFVAAGYMRGIRYVNIPTTLLAMVDAAIGGKTAVNLKGCKNQVGFFHAPEAVCIDPAFLHTLPQSESLSGWFEMFKCRLVGALFDDDDLWAKPSTIPSTAAVSACAAFKMAVCKADPYDHGIRHILNFGHTFGHAIESHAAARRQPLSHGVAVGLGMWCELYLSVRKLRLADEVLGRYGELLRHTVEIPHYGLADTEEMLAFMRSDKKNGGGEIRCVMLQDVGVPVIDVPVDDNEVRDALLKLHNQLGR